MQNIQLGPKQETSIKIVVFVAAAVGILAIGKWAYPYLSDVFHGSALDGTEANTYKVTRNILEIFNFLGTIFIPITAAVAGSIAYSQIKEAKRAREVSIYVELNNQYCSERITDAKRALLKLEREYKSINPDGDVGLEVFCADKLIKEHRNPESDHPTYSKCMDVVSFLECIGVMTRNGLINKSLILDFMGGTILRADRCLKDYLNWRRQQEKDSRLYANAIWLIQQARDYQNKFFNYDEGDYSLRSTPHAHLLHIAPGARQLNGGGEIAQQPRAFPDGL
jgi:hypothetical protein